MNVEGSQAAAPSGCARRAAVLKLAADADRRAQLRSSLRERIRASSLGDTEGVAREFHALMERCARSGWPGG